MLSIKPIFLFIRFKMMWVSKDYSFFFPASKNVHHGHVLCPWVLEEFEPLK